jgi:SAM-dependent methyltransferase
MPTRAREAPERTAGTTPCRFCGSNNTHVMVDLGMSPLCECYLTLNQLDQMEPFYPLCAVVCPECMLAQIPAYVPVDEIFTEYAYFSSYSSSWVEHARRYCERMQEEFRLGPDSLVLELASNDGYLLQYFVARGVPVLGIEPAANVARVAETRGVPTLTEFFGTDLAIRLATEGRRADLVTANNVLAQVPDLNDFVAGIKLVLKPDGVATVEYPHLKRLIEGNQFDTIYHEHFSYFSLLTSVRIFQAHGLTVFDVEELPTHGGSLRLYVGHVEYTGRAISGRVAELLARERAAGMEDPLYYSSFGHRVEEIKHSLLELLIGARREGRSVVGYGAPGKGNTLLNFCGIRTDLLAYTVDRNPYKQGRFLPGTHIPIYHPDRITETRPDYILILPWNLRSEIVDQLAYVREWGARFIVPIPHPQVFAENPTEPVASGGATQ